MKRYLKVFAVASLLFSSVSSFAEYDAFNCVTNPNLDNAGLQCISCGLTKFYADRGIEVNPSHKWLALLAVRAREKGFGSSTDSVVRSSTSKERMQKTIIQDLQAYGFCNEYLGKSTAKSGRSRNYHDMSADDWKMFFEFITRDKIPSEKSYAQLAERLGFKDPGFFVKGTAKNNLDYLFEGAYEGYSLEDKRKIFKEKLSEALAPEYNVSGERVEKAREFIANGDKDEGLRTCLTDLKKRFFEKEKSDKETFEMCDTIAKACEIERVPMDYNKDFCVHKGMGLKPVAPGPAKGTLAPPKPGSPAGAPGAGVR